MTFVVIVVKFTEMVITVVAFVNIAHNQFQQTIKHVYTSSQISKNYKNERDIVSRQTQR